MNHRRNVALFIAALGLAVLPLLSQTTAAQKPSFEVVSIKPTPPGNGPRGGGPRGDRFTMAGATLRMLLQVAYTRRLPGPGQIQILGAPSWIDGDRYDVEAKADCSGGPISREQFQLMVQSLLENRFLLKARVEARELPIYELVVTQDGHKIKPSADQTPVGTVGATVPALCAPPPTFQPPPPGQRGAPFDPTKMRGFMAMQYSPGSATAIGNAVPISTLMTLLQMEGGRPAIDKTNLKGLFDFKLQFSPERMNTPFGPGGPAGVGGPGVSGAEPAGPATTLPAAVDPVPPLITAIQQQLGLKLESTKGPVEVLVIESAQKPTEN